MKNIKLLFFILLISANNLYAQPGWQLLNSGTTTYLSSVFFNDTLTGYIGGNNGYLAKTTNGGINWITLTSGIVSGFVRDIEFINYNTGYICGDNSALRKPLTEGLTGRYLVPALREHITQCLPRIRSSFMSVRRTAPL
jgi:photosystem II stability/assembly factor-like uncharacterized protein